MYKQGVNESVLYERGVNVSYTTIGRTMLCHEEGTSCVHEQHA